MTTRALLIAFLLGLCLMPGFAAAQADTSKDDDAIKADPGALEYPDQPPGVPAQPVPGARKAEPVLFRRHTTVQANVDANGANIPGDAANEPSIAVDPTNPQRMAIGWRQFDTVQSNFRQAGVGYTTDGGHNWTFPGVLEPGVFRSDPVLAADADGNFYFNSLHEDFTTDVWKSTNGGAAWNEPVYAWGGDKQWMVIDNTHGIGRGNIYSFWTAGNDDFTRSLNHGASFVNPSSIAQAPQWGTMDVAPDGTLSIVGTTDLSSYVLSKSADAKNPLDPSTSFTTNSVNLGGTLRYFEGPNPVGILGQPWVATDHSGGPTNGFMYIVGSVNPNGSDPLDVNFIRSTDGGTTWSTPRKLNDDPGVAAWQWMGTMSVAPNGRIDVVWNDTRHFSVVNMSELYYTRSTDGGFTWSPNEQLSPGWDSFVGWPQQQKIGDYYTMVSDRVGANLAWAATFNGEQDVYYMRIGDFDCNGNGVGDSLDIANGPSGDSNGNGIPDECEGIMTGVAEQTGQPGAIRNTPNPFQGSTEIHFEMSEAGGPAHVRIYNAGGQLVRSLVAENAKAGKNSLTWNGNDDEGSPVAAGLYLYELEANGVRGTERMLLLR